MPRAIAGVTRRTDILLPVATLLLALCYPPNALSLRGDLLPSQYMVDRFTRAQGLPSDTVWMAREGPRGYLWLGTKYGLVRYDGVRFDTFNTETESAFQSNDIRVVAWDRNGTQWLGTYGGGALFRSADGWQSLGSAEGLESDTVYDFHFADDGSVWIATGAGVSRWQNGRLSNYSVEEGLADRRNLKIGQAADGTLWFSTLTNGLARQASDGFEPFTAPDTLTVPQVHLLFDDPELGLLAGTLDGSIYNLDSGRPLRLQPTPLQRALPFEEAQRDRDGNLWLGTYGEGLWRLAPGDTLKRIPLEDGPGYIFDIYEDSRGNVWASTTGGLYRLRDSNFRAFGAPEGVADATFVVTEDAAGRIYAGTESGGLFRIEGDRVTAITEEDGLALRSVSALLSARDGSLWVGTFGGGITRFVDGAVEQINRADGLDSDHIIALQEDGEAGVWIATSSGLHRWHAGAIEEVPYGSDTTDDMVRHIMQDRRGRIWLSTNSGLQRRDGANTRWFRESDGLPSNLISGTYEDADGILWIASREGGLARLDGETIHTFGLREGLPQLSVLAILEDERVYLWLSGSGGLVRVSREELNAVARGERKRVSARFYDEKDGLRSAQFLGGFQPAAWRAADDTLWFPTNRGLVAVEPGREDTPPPRPRPLIERIRIDGEPAPLDASLVLPADLRSLEVDYTAPYLGDASALSFRYRVGGNGNSWQEAGDRRTAYFTSLPPGHTRLEVQSRHRSGRYDADTNIAQLSIYREPHWYQTWWALVLGCIGAWLVFISLYRLAERRARQRERELESLVSQRTRELSAALTRVEELSRTDSLTEVANRRYFDERLESAWRQATRSGEALGLIMLDLDRFKEYNDAAGHQAGDGCLKQVASALSTGTLREQDLIARYGGEEFIVLLQGADDDTVVTVARRLMERVRALKLRHPASDISPYVTLSVGCTCATTGEVESTDALIGRADQALYQAKSAGRDQLKVFDPRSAA